MRQRFKTLAALCAAMLIFQSSHAHANVLGSDNQHFNATTNGLDFVTVHSSETLRPGVLNLGFFMNYAVNTLPFLEAEAKRYGKIRDSLTAADFNVGYGLFRNFDLGISFPYIVKQVVNSSKDRGEFARAGNTEIRGNIKYRFFGNDEGGGAIIVSANHNRVVDNPYSGIDAGMTVNYELALDTTVAGIAMGVNLGYRDRNPGKQDPIFVGEIAPIGDQYIYSAAMSYHIQSINSKLIAEAYASQPAKKNQQSISRQQSSSEFLMGIKHDLLRNVALHAGAATELAHAMGTPDYRLYVGVNMTFGGVGKKKKPKLVAQKIKKKPKPKKKPALPAPDPIPEPEPIVEEPAIPQDEPEAIPEGGPGDEVFVLRDVNFLFDSDTQVLGGAKDEMQKLADRLTKQGYSKIIIEGHTDSFGSEEYNMKLGQSRANMIRDYLVNVLRMDGSKIEAVSLGESKPIANNGNYQGRQMNRRVVFRVFY